MMMNSLKSEKISEIIAEVRENFQDVTIDIS